MAGWQEELNRILQQLGVASEEEHTNQEQATDTSLNNEPLPEITYMSLSKHFHGVFYRVDLLANEPQLRIGIPIDTGHFKFALYIVRLAHYRQLPSLFTAQLQVEGSDAFHEYKGHLEYHLLQGYAEVMKLLFWHGDRDTMTFPPEITVEQLL